jgi:adenosylhomocysteinase
MTTQTVLGDIRHWAAREMPVLLLNHERLEREKPLRGVRVSARPHVTL